MSGLIEVDFTEVTEPIPAGTYNARITNAEAKVSESGWKYVRWEMETYGAEEAAHNGRKVITSTATTGKGAFRLKDLIWAATGQELGKTVKTFNPEMLLGKELAITLKAQEGSRFPEVTNFKPITQ